MPNIDLEPHQYADRDPKSGKWRRPLSKRAAMWWFLVCLVAFLFVLIRSNEMTSMMACGVGALFAFAGGVFAQQWLRDLY